jgi:hypothetical protein
MASAVAIAEEYPELLDETNSITSAQIILFDIFLLFIRQFFDSDGTVANRSSRLIANAFALDQIVFSAR